MSENFLTAKINITLVSAAHCRFHLHKTKLLLERERRFCAAGNDYKERRKNDRAHAQNYIAS